MRIHLEHIALAPEQSFLFRIFRLPRFDGVYHNHPEYELTLIVKSSGQRCVGNQLSSFRQGELVLLGPNIPHYWRNQYTFQEKKKRYAESIVIQFLPDFLGEAYFGKPELKSIKKLLEHAKYGLQFTGKAKELSIADMRNMESQTTFERMISLLEILNRLSTLKNVKKLSDAAFLHPNRLDMDRISKIYRYIDLHFRDTISLEQLADISNLTPSSLCRYFKRVTKRTLFDVIGEHRISYACHLLNNSNKSISEICFECGYSIPAHFYKQFKKYQDITPFQYRKTIGDGNEKLF